MAFIDSLSIETEGETSGEPINCMPYAIDVCHINVMMCVLRNVADYTTKPAKIIVTSTTVNV